MQCDAAVDECLLTTVVTTLLGESIVLPTALYRAPYRRAWKWESRSIFIFKFDVER